MIALYRGDTFTFELAFNETLNPGDIITVGAKKDTNVDTKYELFKTITVSDLTDSFVVVFEAGDTTEIIPGEYILEVQVRFILTGELQTAYQKIIKIKGDVITNVNN